MGESHTHTTHTHTHKTQTRLRNTSVLSPLSRPCAYAHTHPHTRAHTAYRRQFLKRMIICLFLLSPSPLLLSLSLFLPFSFLSTSFLLASSSESVFYYYLLCHCLLCPRVVPSLGLLCCQELPVVRVSFSHYSHTQGAHTSYTSYLHIHRHTHAH